MAKEKSPVAEIKTFKTIHEKYKFLSENTRQQRGVSWYKNPDMDENLPDGNFTLVQILDEQYNRENSPFKEQGYVKYIPQAEIKPPVEARKVRDLTKGGKVEGKNYEADSEPETV